MMQYRYHYQLPGHGSSVAQRWLQTAIAAIAGAALLVLGFFFAVFAAIVLATLVAGIALRGWWIVRKARRAASERERVMEGEYRVVDRESGDRR
jgi:uncharacterized membrane protein YphA (DoxX/SURF4 family)